MISRVRPLVAEYERVDVLFSSATTGVADGRQSALSLRKTNTAYGSGRTVTPVLFDAPADASQVLDVSSVRRPSTTSTVTSSPSVALPPRISIAAGSAISRWITRFSGRAPNDGS